MDRLDLAIDMRARLGDWFRVMHLASAGTAERKKKALVYEALCY